MKSERSPATVRKRECIVTEVVDPVSILSMQTTVSIPGMHCESCVALIKDVSAEFGEISRVDIDLGAKRVTLEHADGFDTARWRREIESLGEKYKISSVI